MPQTTELALAASLKRMLSRKPLDRITVVDLTRDCGVDRQTFYYHFRDIHDLVEWIYTSEAGRIMGDRQAHGAWKEGLLHLFQDILENRDLVLNTYHSVSREHLERYLYRETFRLLANVVEEDAAGMGVRPEDRRFIADFYKYAFTGILLDWIRAGMKEDPSYIVRRLDILISGDIPRALKRFQARCLPEGRG